MVDIPKTFGALLIGGIIAAAFSGIVVVQVFVYFKHYPSDVAIVKALVIAVCVLDVCHTVFVTMSLWDHLIQHFGEVARIDYIPWSLALTIAFTAILTFLVHCFFVHRIYKLSGNNLLIAIPLAAIAGLRLCFACLTTVKMITLRSLHEFVKQYTWSFTSGLALSTLLDILITGFLCFFLMIGRKKNVNASINHILDSLMLYAFENGSLTCAATVVSMLCWLTMPTNLIFMGLHFVISKFYANSLLATLNTRKNLGQGYHSRSRVSVSGGHGAERGVPVYLSDSRDGSLRVSRRFSCKDDMLKPQKLQINVEESTITTIDTDKTLVRTSQTYTHAVDV
ncbi:hypothetical protein LshimejAT787_1402890 [Lyophyllum shimeji]|uniref:DUF6534 domain-containing protein n=1 Tax=Lyophyllum shimeji TaxID=47721 RepID=A0A9P3PVM2_LYOSH|nr:hypothetical protein LshimejAT787_1402890 [Lyophyllum shimeji]